jgi:flagellin-specific chaperone FliS
MNLVLAIPKCLQIHEAITYISQTQLFILLLLLALAVYSIHAIELMERTTIQRHNTKIARVWDPIMHFKSWY